MIHPRLNISNLETGVIRIGFVTWSNFPYHLLTFLNHQNHVCQKYALKRKLYWSIKVHKISRYVRNNVPKIYLFTSSLVVNSSYLTNQGLGQLFPKTQKVKEMVLRKRDLPA